MRNAHHEKSRIRMALWFFILLCSLWSCQKEQQDSTDTSDLSETQRPTRTITYYEDGTITVPQKINRIASGWPAQNSVIAMLGNGDKIVATVDMIKRSPIFNKFVPSIKDAVVCFMTSSGELNIEGLLNAKPDVAFIAQGSGGQRFDRLQEMGIPVAYLKANSLKNLVDRTVITGQILGDDAYKRALKYVEYFNNNVQRVKKITSQIPKEQVKKVYHSMGNPLMTNGGPSLVQDWMDLAGVINVAKDWKIAKSGMSTHGNANLEEIIAADPDVIICMYASDVDTIKSDPAWSGIKAVKDCKVYVNPRGMFLWCRESSEEALQFLWLASTVYPEYFPDIDMAEETRYFYKTFYRYDLSDDDVQLFLNPKR